MAPGVLDQAVVGDHPALVHRQDVQDPELQRRQADRLAVLADLERLDVQLQLAGLDLARRAGDGRSGSRRSTAAIRATSSRALNGLVT